MSRKPILHCLFLFKVTILLLVSANVSAQRMMPFEELSREMEGHLLPFAAMEGDTKFVDCATTPIDLIDTRHGERNSQWIYNGFYYWGFARMNGGLCVYLLDPIHRGLTRNEARVLLSASRREFPIAPEPEGEIVFKHPSRPTTRSLNHPPLFFDPSDNTFKPIPESPAENIDPARKG